MLIEGEKSISLDIPSDPISALQVSELEQDITEFLAKTDPSLQEEVALLIYRQLIISRHPIVAFRFCEEIITNKIEIKENGGKPNWQELSDSAWNDWARGIVKHSGI